MVQLVLILLLITTSLQRFSNVADEISAKILSSFLECEVLVVIPDRYSFEFSIKGAERKHRTEDSIYRKLKLLTKENF